MPSPHNSSLHSWIQIPPDCDFPLENLPFGIFEAADRDPRVGVAIGEYVLDVYVLTQYGLFDMLDVEDPTLFHRAYLNDFISLGRPIWQQVRNRISELLRNDSPEIRDNTELMRACLVKRAEAKMLLPVHPDNFIDFYSHKPAHAPGQSSKPTGYHSRTSLLLPSGAPVHRPAGKIKPSGGSQPVNGASQQLDFELKTAFVVGGDTQLGTSLTTVEADEYIFGMVVLLDWVARDLKVETVAPAEPLLFKHFATTVSPWVVMLEALEPFRVAGPTQESVLPSLEFSGNKHLNIHLKAFLQTPAFPDNFLLCDSNAQHVYWNMNQQLAHHTVNGGVLQVGDLFASGNLSSPSPEESSCLLERTQAGTQSLLLPDGSFHNYLQDGDTVVLHGYAEENGIRVGFGEITAQILPAI